MKSGYLSQVVSKISKMMIEHNAVVVFEDLNFGFKRGRSKIEKQIYQKLEKMLIDKLNYLVFKDKKDNELGGIYKAMQLTEKFVSFEKMNKQTGFVFYVLPHYTSKICPKTGFINLLGSKYTKYKSIHESKEFFGKFEKIAFNREGYFEFHFNYKSFTKKSEGLKDNWIVCSYGSRLINERNKDTKERETGEIDLTQKLKELFKGMGIVYEQEQCIKSKIVSQDETRFFKELIFLLQKTLQLRNSRVNSKEDWILSPVKGKDGKFFDSRESINNMPQDADANGAYHIALKGILLLERFKRLKESEKFKTSISNKEWYGFIQDKKR